MSGFVSRAAVLPCLLLVACGGIAGAESWHVARIDTDAWLPSSIDFVFSDRQLMLNNGMVYQPGYSSKWSRTVHLAGVWAACGSVDTAGHLVPDPYATLVFDNYNEYALYHRDQQVREDEHFTPLPWEDLWEVMGHVVWGPGTPSGYVANLILGAHFNGNGEATYSQEGPPLWSYATGTVVLDDRFYYYPDVHEYSVQAHTFDAAYVPEPSAAAALLVGLGGLRRRRPMRRKVLETVQKALRSIFVRPKLNSPPRKQEHRLSSPCG